MTRAAPPTLSSLAAAYAADSNPNAIIVKNPATRATIGTVANGDTAAIRHAVTTARNAQPTWAAQPFRQRARLLRRLHDDLLDNPDPLIALLQAEGGKTLTAASAEVLDTVSAIRYYSYRGEKWLRPQRRIPGLPFFSRSQVIHKPLGVVGFIAPWNFPLALSLGDAIPALLAGNTVVVKPSEYTPYAALWAQTRLQQLGLPDGVYQVVTGDGTTGAALVNEADAIAFTGSTATGRKIAAKAASRLIPLSLELGGKNSAIVLPDIDVEHAVDLTIDAAFSHSGQVCLTMERVFVPQSHFDTFVAGLQRRLANLSYGVSDTFNTQLGPVVTREQIDRMQAHIADAIDHGARIVAGGAVRTDIGPHFVEPAVLVDVPPQARAYYEETFAPLLSVYPYTRLEDAIRAANDTAYGLNASVFTGNPNGAQAQAVARQLDVGSVNINEWTLGFLSYDTPMSGIKQSGLGVRHGRQGLLKHTHPHTIVTLQRRAPYQFPRRPLSMTPAVMRLLRTTMRLLPYIPWWR